MAHITKISYSESRTVPTEKKYESKRFFFSAEMEITPTDCLKDRVADLKKFVKDNIDKNALNQ